MPKSCHIQQSLTLRSRGTGEKPPAPYLNVRPRMATLVALQQNQRLSAWAEQPRGGEATKGQVRPRRAAFDCELRQNAGRSTHRRIGFKLPVRAVLKGREIGRLCLFSRGPRSGARSEQRAFGAALFSSGARHRSSPAAAQNPALHSLQRGAGSICARPSRVTTPGSCRPAYRAQQGASRPNPSLKRSANGRPPGPRGAVNYSAPRGPGVLPSAPA